MRRSNVLTHPTNPFYTPGGSYYASAADAAFWTKVERERVEREAVRRAGHLGRHALPGRAA